ncbi:PhzF family phenazine biosynthesis protein [Actinotalea sp. Marseille-Q4924]|uniref:PhzF family phenazine biosynthesis protein n=1 Tax=Actinotalea sp. Marseille-Q4924 TaxID=2866571 RepID=UPI001CE49822|nr:PhzF family phenazine biosynthesis protein [Actinotalea sp. Marseille-Q4924]
MTARRFAQVDVFTAAPLLGNPVAVVLDAQGLTTEQMQRFTDWTNLSEATFLVPPTHPDADYAVRIFTAGRELPFAGHPTLGTCHAWLAAGGTPRGDVVVQECGAGLVPVRRGDDGVLAFAAPGRRRTGPLDEDDVRAIAEGLGLARGDVVDHAWCDNGPPWQTVLLRSADDVLAVRPRADVLGERFVGVVGPHAGGDVALEVRGFFPRPGGFAEDPVTGSLNAAVGQWLIEAGRVPERYVAAQGTALGRAGRVAVERVGGQVWVGGGTVTVLEGTAAIG